MRTKRELNPEKRVIYHTELSACPICNGSLMTYDYLTWDKTVQTLSSVISVASRPSHCVDTSCAGHSMHLLSAEGQQIAPKGFGYGYDVVTRIGWLRQDRRDIYADIHSSLPAHLQISLSHIRYLYQDVYLPLLACQERQYKDQLEQAAQQYGGLVIDLDGLAPVGGEPQLWFIRELLTGLTLRSGWLSRQDQDTFEAFLQPLSELGLPISAVLSDKQKGLVPAVATVLSEATHQFCQSHYLRNLADPLAKADSSFKVELRKDVRHQVGDLIRAEQPHEQPKPEHNVLTMTGLLPSVIPTDKETDSDEILLPDQTSIESPTPLSEEEEADEIVTHLLRRARYLLTLKGRPPFRLAGIETYQRLQELKDFASDLLAHRHHDVLEQLSLGLQQALTQSTDTYQELQRGAGWLGEIDAILKPADDGSSTSQKVEQQLRDYLDELLSIQDLSPRLDSFRHHLDTVSVNYWPGLFHCYDAEEIPRTNNELESHFRDTKRQLLRTTGQKGQVRRTLERTGAWELLPRPPDETERLAALRSVSSSELRKERERLHKHLERFRFHSRSSSRTNAQFEQLRRRWKALAATSTG